MDERVWLRVADAIDLGDCVRAERRRTRERARRLRDAARLVREKSARDRALRNGNSPLDQL